MPVYDYRCEKCGSFEKVQRITEEALSECPNCGGEVQRIISKNVAIVFKGSGFYSTDNKKTRDTARAMNKERQKDNQALLDGDVKSFVKQSDDSDKKIAEA